MERATRTLTMIHVEDFILWVRNIKRSYYKEETEFREGAWGGGRWMDAYDSPAWEWCEYALNSQAHTHKHLLLYILQNTQSKICVHTFLSSLNNRTRASKRASILCQFCVLFSPPLRFLRFVRWRFLQEFYSLLFSRFIYIYSHISF